MPPHASEELADRLRPFATCSTAAIWRHVPVLVAGALLAPGRRTVTAALRVMALDRTASFAVYHRVLSTARWSARAVAHRLLLVLSSPPSCGTARWWGGRDRRHRRAPLGRQDRGARHLPRPGALQPRPLRQGQRPALAVPDGDGADALGRRLGSAVPHRARTFRALRPRPRATPQEADRPGAPGPSADRALAARPARGRGGGQQLLRHRAAARGRPMPVHGHPPAPRCRSSYVGVTRSGTGIG